MQTPPFFEQNIESRMMKAQNKNKQTKTDASMWAKLLQRYLWISHTGLLSSDKAEQKKKKVFYSKMIPKRV